MSHKRPNRKRKHLEMDTDAQNPPTEDEWVQMRRIGGFKLQVNQGEGNVVNEVRFKKGDDAILYSEFDTTSDVWVGTIKQVRQRDDGGVWVRVEWDWSRRDLKQLFGPSFIQKSFAPYERASGDNTDILAPRCFKRTIHKFIWNEASLAPAEFGERDFFVRYDLHWKPSPEQSELVPAVGKYTCLCEFSYNPFPGGSAPPTGAASLDVKPMRKGQRTYISDVLYETMHFCPRPSCRRWYHERCLIQRGYLDNPHAYRGDRGMRLLAVDPYHDEPIDELMPFLFINNEADMFKSEPVDGIEPALADSDAASARPRPPTQTNPIDLASYLKTRSDSLSHLPPALLHSAQQPIVRAPNQGKFSTAGNVQEVISARLCVHEAFIHGGDTFKDLDVLSETQIEAMSMEELTRILGKYDFPAVPYMPYWRRRDKQITWVDRNSVELATLICPSCGAAI